MQQDFDLSGRTAIVTGSGRNIGRAIALELAARGANVVVNSRSNEAEADAVAREIESLGSGALVVLGDASDPATVAAIRERAVERFGHVDICVSNAARRLHRDFFELADEEWSAFLNQQLTASWLLAKAFAPQMRDRGWGRIIHINGPDGWVGGWTRVPHSVAKGGLRTLTKSLAAGLGEFGITVNDVSPGWAMTVRDPVTHPALDPADEAAKIRSIPIRRQPTVDEVAWAVLFLCSERSSAITGTAIHVDGGQWMLG